MEPVNGTIGIADISASRQRLRVSGGDRVEFLHGQCTNDIKRLVVGGSCYAAFLNAKGKMRGEGHIIRVEDAFLLEVNPGLAQSLEKFIITEDVTIEDLSATWGEWVVIGDTAASLPPKAITFSHPLGLGVIGEGSMADTITAETLEVLRVEAAVPKWGADMDENTIPNEAGLEARAISYDKGCYIGQETVARIKTYGHVNRRLVQLAIVSPGSATVPVAVVGSKIFEGEREVGHVTSAVRSLRLGKPVALGYVRREFASTGVKLTCNNEPVEVLRVCGD
jgi:folate-binding protein YgfZ